MSPGAAPAQVHVVAGVLRDARGRILLARRTAGRDLAGAWEFPGGKVEPGEDALQALDRELHEELGVRIHGAKPLIAVPQAYASKRIVLDVYEIAGYSGTPRGQEKQALAWSPLEKLSTYPMPRADRPVVAALSQPDVYLVTPEPGDRIEAFLASLRTALERGARRVQLRARTMSGARLAALAKACRELCGVHAAELLINGDIDLAARLDCGLHLRAEQLAGLRERPVAGRVAASCHDETELHQAEALGVDFAVLGPVRATTSHPERKGMGWASFSSLREGVALPIYGIGGLRPADRATIRRHGGQGIAAIRSLWPI